MNSPTNFHRPSHDFPSRMGPKDMGLVTISTKKLQNMNCIFKPSQHYGGLYLGDVISTLKQEILQGSNIRAVLTCMTQRVAIKTIVNAHKIIPIKDVVDYPIINHFDEAVAWIHQRRKEKQNVLVHCHAGVSRSVTIVIAYLIRVEKWNPMQALEFVRQKRERVRPNQGFWNQLNEYYNFWSKQTAIQKIESEGKSQKENIQLNNIDNEPAKVSFFQRRKLFDKRQMQKSTDQRPRRDTLTSSLSTYASKSVMKDRCTTQLRTASFTAQSNCLFQNKSSIQPRCFSQNDPPIPPRILSQAHRPQIRFI